jgi:hypothetical protein
MIEKLLRSIKPDPTSELLKILRYFASLFCRFRARAETTAATPTRMMALKAPFTSSSGEPFKRKKIIVR